MDARVAAAGGGSWWQHSQSAVSNDRCARRVARPFSCPPRSRHGVVPRPRVSVFAVTCRGASCHYGVPIHVAVVAVIVVVAVVVAAAVAAVATAVVAVAVVVVLLHIIHTAVSTTTTTITVGAVSRSSLSLALQLLPVKSWCSAARSREGLAPLRLVVNFIPLSPSKIGHRCHRAARAWSRRGPAIPKRARELAKRELDEEKIYVSEVTFLLMASNRNQRMRDNVFQRIIPSRTNSRDSGFSELMEFVEETREKNHEDDRDWQ
ncbi:hypothetical protein ALC53_12361 [Atta colombica]|uniref:Uncharacterized protein n=1 Tax=Atta colombica TaxID=520822 RepID=A0A195AZJ6_9HYME|nr:hypothetical protein ALC53_12361 [Atta colombica]